MSAVARGQGPTTNGREAATARDTALRGKQPRMAEYRIVARSVVRDRETGRDVSLSCLGIRRRTRADGVPPPPKLENRFDQMRAAFRQRIA